jgi:hypothetical protein
MNSTLGFSIRLILIAICLIPMGCSRNLKAPDSQYDFAVQGEGFIYGKLEFQNRDVTQVKLLFLNEGNQKQKTYWIDFTDHLYARREHDFVLRVPSGEWSCIRADLFTGNASVAPKGLKLLFSVESERGSYLGTWNFNPSGDLSIQDEKGTQDGKIAEAYPRLNLNRTQATLPKL